MVGAVQAGAAEAPAGRRAEILAGLSAVVAVALGPVADASLVLPFAARFIVALVVLMPVGLLGGSLISLGTRLVGSVSQALVPWCWSLGATGAFVAAAVAAFVAMILGYSAVLLLAGASAVVAAACVPRAAS
jgi:hypothetical protein